MRLTNLEWHAEAGCGHAATAPLRLTWSTTTRLGRRPPSIAVVKERW